MPDREIAFPKDKETKLGHPYSRTNDTTKSYFFTSDFYHFGDNFWDSYPVGTVEKTLDNFHLMHTYFRWKVDSFYIDWFSEKLQIANEPVLKNEHPSHNIYRFMWLRSFDPDYIFTFHHHADSSLLKVKKIIGESVDSTAMILPSKDFYEFQNLVNRSNFWIQKTYDPLIWLVANDGAEWVFEAHTEWTYKLMSRHNPQLVKEDEYIIRLLGQWLINKSEIQVERMY